MAWDNPAARGALQQGNNTTLPSFFDLGPIILSILAGVGIATVIVAAGLWIAGRRRRGKGWGNEGEEGENDEWGARW